VPTTSHTSPGANTPAPSVAAISSPHPTATTVEGSRLVASANAAVIIEIGSVAVVTSGRRDSGRSTAASASGDHSRDLGSSSAIDEAFE
jgi:hypothetical protein